MTIRGVNEYLCPLWTFVPFTNNYDSKEVLTRYMNETGFLQMSAAVVAMNDFNIRNASMVPELDDDFMINCPVQFDMPNSRFFDSGQYSHIASGAFSDALLGLIEESSSFPGEDKRPCAIAGPFYDTPAVDLSVLAESVKIPMVAHRVFAPRVLDLDASGTYTSQVYPSAVGQTEFVLKAIERFGRTDFLTVLYPTTEMGTQVREAFVMTFDRLNIEHWFTQFYVHPGRDVILEDPRTWGSLREAMIKVKERGFRTIVTVLQYAEKEIPVYAQLAEELGMNDGHYLWVWFGLVETKFAENILINRLMDGSFFIEPLEYQNLINDNLFRSFYKMIDPEIPDMINTLNPLKPGDDGYIEASVEFFNNGYSATGQQFLYDAVMSIGIGACKAYEKKMQEKPESGLVQIQGLEHVQGIRSVDFEGFSGRVRFENEGQNPGTRKAEDFLFNGWNVFFDGESMDWNTSTFYVPSSSGVFKNGPWASLDNQWYEFPEELLNSNDAFWYDIQPYIYFGGSSTGPPLRDQPNMNYLSAGLRGLGLFLCFFLWFAVLIVVAFVYRYRQHKVLRAAQPQFLYLLCFGAFVFSCAIIPLSFDEGYGWNAGQLGVACRSTPWLATIGYIITYGALFSKLFRVNKVLQFTRRKVELHQVMWPVGAFMGMALLVLTVWTAAFPLHWERKVLNEFTGDSIGMCVSDYMGVFASLLAVLAVLPLIMTAVMAWVTKDIDDAYSESKWIFILILLQLELIVLGAPVLTILRGLSTNGRYVGFVIIIWAFSISALVMIMLPKVLAYRAAITGTENQQSQKRGQKAGVKVSGIGMSPATMAASYSSTTTYNPSNSYNFNNKGGLVNSSMASHYDQNHDSYASCVRDESHSEADPDPIEVKSGKTHESSNSFDAKSCQFLLPTVSENFEAVPEPAAPEQAPLVMEEDSSPPSGETDSPESQLRARDVLKELAVLYDPPVVAGTGSGDDTTDLISYSGLEEESV